MATAALTRATADQCCLALGRRALATAIPFAIAHTHHANVPAADPPLLEPTNSSVNQSDQSSVNATAIRSPLDQEPAHHRRNRLGKVFQGHTRSVTACQLSNDGTALSSSDDGTLRLSDTATGETLRVYLALDSGTACFDPRPIRDENDTTPRLIHATGEIWRHLAWQIPTVDGGWERVPLETFGDVVQE